MKDYDHKKIEPKWQKEWDKNKIYHASNKSKKPKFYSLIEFPYPSGDGLHVGHPRPYIGMDVISRKRRMEGFNVLYPIGWDAFGLPTENYAIKTGKDPRVVTKKNTDNFRKQIKSIGVSFDWSREINTTDPKYYKWTQWIFLQFFKNGLAYKKNMLINWCPKDKTGLANEEVIDGACERCGTPVEQKDKDQWMLAITKYADRLDKDLDDVNYLPQIKLAQRNWIGRSEGAVIKFDDIEIFTTRPDTIFGATFVVIAGEKDRFTGRYVTNPATKEKIPLWEAEYVMEGVGTGAVMGVPSDDERDRDFANKHGLPIVENYKKAGFEDYGKKVTRFKLRDWVFSRQRYWGEPIPIIHCGACGVVPVPEKDLPVELPKVKNYQPTDNGESPLANISKWVNVKCPKCKAPAKRETDTMPNWAGSSWYYLRYTDSTNTKAFADKKILKYWTPVNWYNGGNEHTTLHLLYSRFWHKFLFDIGLVPTAEPYMKRTSHGMILGEGGVKMSKSLGNVINPNEIVSIYGADTLRVYEMFMGPFEQAIAWSEEAIVGSRRFLEKVWKISGNVSTDKISSRLTLPGLPGGSYATQKSYQSSLVHKTIKKVSSDIENMRFNTAISSLMILATEMQKADSVPAKDFKIFLSLLAPFAPHMAEELWAVSGEKKSIHLSAWPEYDESLAKEEEIKIAIQVNGKVRSEIIISEGDSEEDIKKRVFLDEAVLRHVNPDEVKKTIYIKNRLLNIVI